MQHIDTKPRMSACVVHNGFAFTAGQVDVTASDVASQTTIILAKIESLLERAGTNKANIVSANIWLRDIAHFEDFNAVWDAWVPAPAPARATVQSILANPKYLIEIAVVAAVDGTSAS
jgi:enamine deaminase RidA (YjgF/YER057c/UK114 family)